MAAKKPAAKKAAAAGTVEDNSTAPAVADTAPATAPETPSAVPAADQASAAEAPATAPDTDTTAAQPALDAAPAVADKEVFTVIGPVAVLPLVFGGERYAYRGAVVGDEFTPEGIAHAQSVGLVSSSAK
ncbi:hypothetical protein [Leucobacter salsicius]|uniref:hypothetical protein n=1 Tax=Leucobacter salsicius TaxID=664638 RepID=UPI000344B90A|nr:hypothetical protein [Leucobacter salsicius]